MREFAGLVSRCEGDATSPLLAEFEAIEVDFCLELPTLFDDSCLSITIIEFYVIIIIDRELKVRYNGNYATN